MVVKVNSRYWNRKELWIEPGGGGVLDLSLGRGVPPGPRRPDPVYDKKFMKILKNLYPVYDFQVKIHSFFHQNV